MPPIISIENLGKCYTIRHNAGGGPGYRRLSEELASALARPFRRKSTEQGAGSTEQVDSPRLSGEGPGVTASSESFWALRNVSFDVREGEVLGIIGRNGAGKSTLLKILSRITEPSEGRVTLRGRVASLLEVGTGFHPELTGRENVYFNGAVLGMSRAEIKRKFDEIVAFAEVEKFLDTPVKHYSSGMYVRLAFAVAAHLEPEILIVDEVLAVGDAEFQKKCLGKMGEVAHGGRTVLFVSHNMAAIRSLTKRAVLLHAGRVACDSSPSGGIAAYHATFGNAGVDSSILQNRGLHTSISQANLLSSDGSATDVYIPGRAFELEIQFTTDGTHGMSLELFLVDSQGVALAFSSLYQFHGVSLPVTPGEYVCGISLKPMLLAAGSYTLDAATSIPNKSWDCELSNLLSFTVPFSNATGRSWNFESSQGYGAYAWLVDGSPRFRTRSEGRICL